MKRIGGTSSSPRPAPGRNFLKASNAISSRKTPPAKHLGTEDCSFSTAERFTLSGPSILLDPSFHAFRADLADVALAAHLFAPHYARPVTRHCGPVAAAVRGSPTLDSEELFQLDAGEEFALLDVTGGWGWGYRRSDHRVGYVRVADLS